MFASSLLPEEATLPWTGSRYASALRRHDYKEIAGSGLQEGDDALDVYLLIRSLLILGRYADAQKILEARTSQDNLTHFLWAQVSLYTRRDIKGALAVFESLRASFMTHAYWRGEVHFLIGYGYNIANNFKTATRYLRIAADAYAEAGLIGCEGVAVFNLSVAYDHLDEREHFTSCCHRLEALVTRPEAFSIRLLRHLAARMRAICLLDKENYQGAVAAYREAFALVHEDQRWHDIGALGCMLMFCFIKLRQDDEALVIADMLLAANSHLVPPHRHMIAALLSLIHKPFFRSEDVEWLRSMLASVESVHAILLYELSLERLVKSEDFFLMIELAREGQKLSLSGQQSLGVVDMRFYEIYGLLKCGQLQHGSALLAAYQSDARERSHVMRQQKAAKLKELLHAQKADLGEERSVSLLPHTMTLDLRQHSLRLDEHYVDLSSKPLLEKFIQLLMSTEKTLALDVVFQHLYQYPYHPSRHDRRLHSLVGRLRSLAGHNGIVIRRNGGLLLAPAIRRVLRQASAPDETIRERRQRILEAIAKKPGTTTISELETLFTLTRRTIQHDLAYLVSEGKLRLSGSTRNRRYRLRSLSVKKQ